MANLLFNNVQLLGYNHQNNFFGERSLFYSSTRTISLSGYILDLVIDNGVTNIFGDVNNLLKQIKDFQNVIINSQNYGTGKVKSFSVDSGNWVRTTTYSAEIEVLVEVPISDLNSKEFNDIDISNKKFNLIKNFSETFSLDFDTQNKVLNGEHSIDIEYDANNKNIDLIKLAQSLATELLKTIPSSSNIAEGNYLTRTNYKVLNSENYDLINHKCGFRRSFSYSTLDNNKPYSVVTTHSVAINENGIATVSESSEIKAESDDPSLYKNALLGYNEKIPNVYNRCNDVFQNYKLKFNIVRNLNSHPINKSVQINKFTGVINFNVEFDNDPKNQSPLYFWEYSSLLDRNENGVWTVSERGNVRGNGKSATQEKYNNAQNAWSSTIKNNISTRLTTFYTNESTNGAGTPLKEIGINVTKSKYNGTINYDYKYTDDPSIKDGSDAGIRKVSIEKSDTGLLPIIKTFIIPNKTYALVQNRYLKQQGTYTVKVDMSIGCLADNSNYNSYTYFAKAKSYAGGLPGLGNDEYVESVSYNSNEIDKTVSYSATYKYS